MYIFVAIAYHLARQSRSHACALIRTNKSDSANVLTKQMKDFLVGLWQQSAVERPRELSLLSTLDEIEANRESIFLQKLLKAFTHQGSFVWRYEYGDPELNELSQKARRLVHLRRNRGGIYPPA